jgi:hypothetical protein
MGRTKPVAKRRRREVQLEAQDDDDNEIDGHAVSIQGDDDDAQLQQLQQQQQQQQQQEAIQLLLQASPDDVEAAAALATRRACEQHWPRLLVEEEEEEENDRNDKKTKNIRVLLVGLPSWLRGLGISRPIPVEHFQTLQQLHEDIKSKVGLARDATGTTATATSSRWTSWSGSKDDPRKRAFGILSNTLGADTFIQQSLDISTPWKEEDRDHDGDHPLKDERTRNHQAMVFLEMPPPSQQQDCPIRRAIDALCDMFLETLPISSPLRPYLCYQNLIAVQPNLHCGRALLPSHLDHPQKDGFGIIIVTVSMVGSALILLQDAIGEQQCTLRVSAGEAYMLSDKARDACSHGILADEGSEHRESLNLRFGIHDIRVDGRDCSSGGAGAGKYHHPFLSSDTVLQYWESKG